MFWFCSAHSCVSAVVMTVCHAAAYHIPSWSGKVLPVHVVGLKRKRTGDVHVHSLVWDLSSCANCCTPVALFYLSVWNLCFSGPPNYYNYFLIQSFKSLTYFRIKTGKQLDKLCPEVTKSKMLQNITICKVLVLSPLFCTVVCISDFVGIK